MAKDLEKILYMAASLNGYIARKDDETDFVSDDEWEKGFMEALKEVKNIIIGRTTYEVMSKDDVFAHLLDGLIVVIVSENSTIDINNSNHFHASSPENAIEIISEKGFEKTLIAGGTILNSSFLEKGLVDKIVIDIEPILVASGKQLYQSDLKDISLEFVQVKNLTENLLQLTYEVKK